MQVLVIDSDQSYLESTKAALRLFCPDAHTDSCSKGKDGLHLAETNSYELIVVDLDMTDMNGFDFLKQLTASYKAPLITLKESPRETDIIRAIELGADECYAKSIHQFEFMTRIKALMRRCYPPQSQSLVSGMLKLDVYLHRAIMGGKEVCLTRSENIVLQHLMTNCGRISTYRSLAQELWGEDYRGSNAAIRVYIDRLRHKLEKEPCNPLIINERGVGFRLVSPI